MLLVNTSTTNVCANLENKGKAPKEPNQGVTMEVDASGEEDGLNLVVIPSCEWVPHEVYKYVTRF